MWKNMMNFNSGGCKLLYGERNAQGEILSLELSLDFNDFESKALKLQHLFSLL